LEKVRSLKRGESLVYLREAVVSKGKKTVPFLTKDEFKSYTLSKIDESAVCLNISLSQPILPTFGEKYVSIISFLKYGLFKMTCENVV
jgi:hypothetical protein